MKVASPKASMPLSVATACLLAVWAPVGYALAQEVRPEIRARQVDAIFAEWDHTNTPGCALGVIKDGKFVYRRGYGMANLEHGVPISTQTVFYIASTSKQFVAASTILAAEQGYLSLDDDIRKYVPEIPDYGHTITIRHLLHHTSGVRDYLTLWSLAGEEFADIHEPEEALELIARQKELNFEPGAEYLYSNSGYFLLSVIIERATGKTLRQFARENIFEPLGMTHSHFHDDHTEISKHRAIGHVTREDGSIAMYVSNFDLVGSGGLHTSVEDLLLWDRNFYENKLGRGTLLDELHRRGVLNNGDTLSYAAGLNIGEYKGLRTVRHGGSAQGYRTELLRFPDQGFSVICLCNLGSINPSRLANRVADIYLTDQLAAAEEGAPASKAQFVTLGEKQLGAWVGAFRNSETRTIWKIRIEGDGLQVNVDGFQFHLATLSPTQVRSVDAPFTVEARLEQKPRRIHARFDDGDEETYEEVELVTPGADQLAEYAGAYYSDELETTWELQVRNDELLLVDGPDGPLAPTIEDEFKLRGITINFFRDAKGKVSGLLVDAGRVRHLRFTRSDH